MKNAIPIVESALKSYEISDFEATFIRHNENITYKVRNNYDHKNYLLRIHEPITSNLQGIQHTFEGLTAEMIFLKAVAEGTDLLLQIPVFNHQGELITTVIDQDKGQSFLVTLLTWVEGGDFQPESPQANDLAYQLGEVSAKIHNFSSHWTIPQPFIRPVYDSNKYVNFVNRLRHGVEIGLFSRGNYEVIVKTMGEIKGILDPIDRTKDNWGIIHADLHVGNIVVNEGHISPIDFGFSGYGYFLFDVGCTIASLKPYLRKSFFDGYQTLREIDNHEFQVIQACFLLSVFGAFSFGVNNPKSHDWIKRRFLEIATDECERFFAGQPFISNEIGL